MINTQLEITQVHHSRNKFKKRYRDSTILAPIWEVSSSDPGNISS